MQADDVIAQLGLEPHPEGGWFRETWRHHPGNSSRGAGTAIYFLLAEGERSHWHRVDADEVFHHYAGAPLQLLTWQQGGDIVTTTLGIDFAAGERPQAVVPEGIWQSATTTGEWTLVGCTVSPAFEFAGFELAAADWHPPQASRQ